MIPSRTAAQYGCFLAASLHAAIASAALPNASASASAAAPPLVLEAPAKTGRETAATRLRPSTSDAPIVACSFYEAVCVHAPRDAPSAALETTLRDAENALFGLRALDLPLPLHDGTLGGNGFFDVYLLARATPPATTIDRLPTPGNYDTHSAFAVLPTPDARAGCEASSRVARAIALGSFLGLDAAASEGVLAMASSYLASLVAPCSLVEIGAVDDLQRSPERAITAAEMSEFDGSMLFPWYLDDVYGTGRPGRVITALIAIATQRTPAGSWRWNNEPDVFDALRSTLKSQGSSLHDLLLDFAVDRAFVGSRSDGAHLGDVERFGDFGRVRFDWSVPYASLPRSLAPLYPIDSTGSFYAWVDLAGAPKEAELSLVFSWELPVLMRWALVKVSEDGTESARILVPGIVGSTRAQKTLTGLEGLAGVMIVAVNLGDIDRANPFDPDEAPFEPHGLTLSIYP